MATFADLVQLHGAWPGSILYMRRIPIDIRINSFFGNVLGRACRASPKDVTVRL